MKQRSFDSETLNSPILGGGGCFGACNFVGEKKIAKVGRVL